MKRLIVTGLALTGLLAMLPASAMFIEGYENRGDYFIVEADEDWESYAVGSAPADAPGSPWTTPANTQPATVVAGTGPWTGTDQYLSLASTAGNNAAIGISFPQHGEGPPNSTPRIYNLGDRLHVEYMALFPSDTFPMGDSMARIFGKHYDAGNPKMYFVVGHDADGTIGYYHIPDDDPNVIEPITFEPDAGLSVTPDRWQRWEIDYTFHDTNLNLDTYVITIDGVSSDPIPTSSRDGHQWRAPQIMYMGLQCSSTDGRGDRAFFINNMIPEPSSVGLMVLGVVGLLGRKRR
jgi:hypothetical protein